jgi:hypothetical protein
LRARALEILAKLRSKKRELLALAPDVLRKSSAVGRSMNAAGSGCRLSNRGVKAAAIGNRRERRLARTSVRTRYQAPQHLRGSRMGLVDGRQLEIPEHAFCELAGGACAGYGPHAVSAAHDQLIAAGFRELPTSPTRR